MHVHVLRFIHRFSSNFLCALLAVRISLLEIMLKQYCRSVRVINHQLDKSSGHCWRIMSTLLTFNAFGLLLVRWIIGLAVMKVENKFCVITKCSRHSWVVCFLCYTFKQIFHLIFVLYMEGCKNGFFLDKNRANKQHCWQKTLLSAT